MIQPPPSLEAGAASVLERSDGATLRSRPATRRLREVLTGQDKSEKFSHLSATDRKAVLEILRETKKGLPDYWQEGTSRGSR